MLRWARRRSRRTLAGVDVSPAEALARRAVAAPGWRWLPGMLQTRGVERHRVELTFHVSLPGFGDPWLPDLTDPATLGCLLALVREAHADPKLRTRFSETRQRWECVHGHATSSLQFIGTPDGDGSEAAALVAALEAAPRRTT